MVGQSLDDASVRGANGPGPGLSRCFARAMRGEAGARCVTILARSWPAGLRRSSRRAVARGRYTRTFTTRPHVTGAFACAPVSTQVSSTPAGGCSGAGPKPSVK